MHSSARAALLPLLLIAIGGCAPAGDSEGTDAPPAIDSPAAPPPPDTRAGNAFDDAAIDGHLRAFVDSIRSLEARRLTDAEAVRRESVTRLVVLPTGAQPVVFEDELSGGDLMRLHIFRGRLLQRFVVLEVIFYEGGQFLLVDEQTGEEYDIDGMPTASPDGARFVTTSLDLVAGHQPNRIAIYRVSDNGVSREWAEEPRDWGPSHAEWIEPTTVRFRANVIDVTAQPHTMAQSVAWVDYTQTGWRLRR